MRERVEGEDRASRIMWTEGKMTISALSNTQTHTQADGTRSVLVGQSMNEDWRKNLRISDLHEKS